MLVATVYLNDRSTYVIFGEIIAKNFFAVRISFSGPMYWVLRPVIDTYQKVAKTILIDDGKYVPDITEVEKLLEKARLLTFGFSGHLHLVRIPTTCQPAIPGSYVSGVGCLNIKIPESSNFFVMNHVS